MKLDNLEKRIVKRAVENPGIYKTELYRPFLTERSGFFLNKSVKCLEVCGFVRIEKQPGIVQVWATKKAVRHIKKLEREGEAQ